MILLILDVGIKWGEWSASRPGRALASGKKTPVPIVTDYRLEYRGVRSPAEANDLFPSVCIQTSSEVHPASYPVDIGGNFPGGKARPGHDADHSVLLVPRSRMSMRCTPVPLGVYMA
jgi:hypothetical protein